jgi:hypothetical protein
MALRQMWQLNNKRQYKAYVEAVQPGWKLLVEQTALGIQKYGLHAYPGE